MQQGELELRRDAPGIVIGGLNAFGITGAQLDELVPVERGPMSELTTSGRAHPVEVRAV